MNDTPPVPPSPIRPQLSTTPAHAIGARDGSASTGGAAFRALIEQLESQASALEKETAEVSGPADLAGAVDRARASLQEALSLSDRLLEAYRESLQRAEKS